MLYAHPPRIQSSAVQDLRELSLNDEWAETAALYTPSVADMKECVFNERDGNLKTRAREAAQNGVDTQT